MNHSSIFTFGRGRSGLVMNMFSMRLMQLGLNVFIIGEPTTPAVKSDNLVVIGSGSGKTEECLIASQKAKLYGAKVGLFTGADDSPIAKLCDYKVTIPSVSKLDCSNPEGLSLAGTIFEQALLITCDCICSKIAIEMGKTSRDVMLRHANIE